MSARHGQQRSVRSRWISRLIPAFEIKLADDIATARRSLAEEIAKAVGKPSHDASHCLADCLACVRDAAGVANAGIARRMGGGAGK